MKSNCLKVNLGKWQLDNPIIPASGTFGFGYDFCDYYDINILGSISVKAVTLKPRFGNPLPRICEVDNGMMNSIGLQNLGVDNVIKYEIPKLKKVFKKQIIANIAAIDIKSYKAIIQKLNNQNNIAIFEINISCPNVKKGALVFDDDPNALKKLLQAIKPISKKPIYVKLSPRVSNIASMATVAEANGADGLTLINTMPGLMFPNCNDPSLPKNRTGGMSGPIIKSIALKAIKTCAQGVKIPIIGCGGISSAYDVIEMMKAGASAVQIGSHNLIDPYACKKIIEELPKVLHRNKISNIKEIIGVDLKFKHLPE